MNNGNLDIADKLAIVGMVGRFPGADTLEDFWDNLKNGVDALSSFTEEELLQSGVAEGTFKKDNYVNAKGFIDHVDLFDAGFFDMTPKEAVMLDPQHRVYLECAWEALEKAGYNPEIYEGRIGVYSGVDANTYLINNLLANKQALHSVGEVEHMLSDKDYISTRVSYKLNLRGASYTVQCACSSSMVALHLATESLLNGENDIALAGGISISFPLKAGYFHEDGGIVSKDGKCKAFDKDADGTIYGNGVGILVLKRLEDALEDGDTIHAVVLGTAVNNDGAVKVGYTAPSIEGQAAVISEALKMAEVPAESIGYIETHGTGTKLGDTIEMAALKRAYKPLTDKKGYCAIGSVKTNIGHLSTAAGVASLIKTVLAIKHGEIPPSLHYNESNPTIDFANSPFYVNQQLKEWQQDHGPRRAGVSSFGLGGTNVHVILEEAPVTHEEKEEEQDSLIVLSAKTNKALEDMENNLQQYVTAHKPSIQDIAYTLQMGRKAFPVRKSYVASNKKELLHLLRDKQADFTYINKDEKSHVVFMFSGFGEQYIGMTKGLYNQNKAYQKALDKTFNILQAKGQLDYKDQLFNGDEEMLRKPSVAYPLLFSVEYAMAQALMAVNVLPSAMIGHSIGEYVAACLSGVLSLEDALELLCVRGALIETLPKGAMLTVMLSEEALRPYLTEGVSLAAVNSPTICGVSGHVDEIEALRVKLLKDAIACIPVDTAYAFHSFMMEEIEDKFLEALNKVTFSEPDIPYISNVTGNWITSDVTTPTYWLQHLKQGIMFHKGLITLCEDKSMIFVEVGPGRVLGSFASQTLSNMDTLQPVVQTILTKKDLSKDEDHKFFLKAIGRLWCQGVAIHWESLNEGKTYGRIPLPTYPYQRRRYYIEPSQSQEDLHGKRVDKSILYTSWKKTILPSYEKNSKASVVIGYDTPFTRELIERLRDLQDHVITVLAHNEYTVLGNGDFHIRVDVVEDYIKVFQQLVSNHMAVQHIICLPEMDKSLLYLLQALYLVGEKEALQLTALTNRAYKIVGNEDTSCYCSMIGLEDVVTTEFMNITYRIVDMEPECNMKQVIDAIYTKAKVSAIGIRNNNYWKKEIDQLMIEDNLPSRIQKNGTYLLFSGIKASAYDLAQELVHNYGCHLIFIEDEEAPINEGMVTQLPQLKGLGSKIDIKNVDFNSRQQLEDLKNDIEKTKPIQGLFHFIEEPAEMKELQHINPDELEKAWSDRKEQLSLMDEIFNRDTTDFVVTLLPLTYVLGIKGSGPYAMEQSLIKSYRDASNRSNWYVVNWYNPQQGGLMLETPIPYDEGAKLIPHILDYTNEHPLIVSPMDLGAMKQVVNQVASQELVIDDVRPSLSVDYIEPRNECDRTIASIWKNILGFSQIGIEDNFFELGGNSLLALQILFRMNQQLHVEIPMADFISDPTIKFLSNYVASIHWIKNKDAEVEKQDIEKDQPLKSFSI